MKTYQLYLGRNIPTGGTVSDTDLKNFYRNVVTNYFTGFTVTNSVGYWNGEEEESVVLTVIGDDSYKTHREVELIAEDYCRRFSQEAVFTTSFDCEATLVKERVTV